MKALTLTQPWAALVAIGEKKWETRSWSTQYRGPIAVHAAKGFPTHIMGLCLMTPFYNVLAKAGVIDWPYHRPSDTLPLGAIVAIARLANCTPTEDAKEWIQNERVPAGAYELDFGDYSRNRYAFQLTDVRPLPKPIPAKGALGLWEWDEHDALTAEFHALINR